MTQFNKPPGWGSRFQFPENQQINFDGQAIDWEER